MKKKVVPVSTRLAFSFLFLLAASSGKAQILTGALRGTVMDENKVALPGVSVALSSPALLGGIHVKMTNENGEYRYVDLPPGLYKIVFTLSGFQAIEKSEIRIMVGKTITENIFMKQSPLEEAVTVTGEAPVVDVTDSGLSTNFDLEQISKVPSGRHSVFDIVKQAPGIEMADAYENTPGIIGLGSNDESNSVQMDGLDITNPRLGTPILFPSQDIMTEVEVLTAGAPAEYGQYTGVVVNIVSKSGGNDFSGALRYFGQYDALTSDNNPDPDQYDSYTRHKYFDLSFSLGGPILKDRLWFFSNANIKRSDLTPWRTDPQYHSPEKEDFYFFKLSGQMGVAHRLTGVFSYRDWAVDEVPTPWIMPESVMARNRHIPNWNFQYTWLITQNAYLSFKTAGFRDSREALPKEGGRDALVNPLHYDGYTGVTSGGVSWPHISTNGRFQAHLNLSYFADDFLAGDHEFKCGVQFNRSVNEQICGYAGDKFYYDFDGQPYLMYHQSFPYYGGRVDTVSAFVDDSWSVGKRLTLNLGLRYDHTRGDQLEEPLWENWKPTGQTLPGIDNLIVWKNFSPRLGFVYQITPDGKTVVKGHYGRYTSALSPSMFDGPGPYVSDASGYLWDGTAWMNFVTIPGSLYWGVRPGLRAPYSDLVSLGLAREILPDLSVDLQGIYKKEKNLLAFWNTAGVYEQVPMISPDNGQTYPVYNQVNLDTNQFEIINPPGFEYIYKGVILSLFKRHSHGWLLNASLAYSRTEGLGLSTTATVEGFETYQSGIISHVGYVTPSMDPNQYLNAKGLLINDRPWHLKIQFAYDLPWDILFGASYQYMSGTPYSTTVRVYPDQGQRRIIAAPRNNDDRMEPVQTLDLRLEKILTVRRGLKFGVLFDVYNALNAGTVLGWASYSLVSSAFREPARMLAPRQVQLGLTLQF